MVTCWKAISLVLACQTFSYLTCCPTIQFTLPVRTSLLLTNITSSRLICVTPPLLWCKGKTTSCIDILLPGAGTLVMIFPQVYLNEEGKPTQLLQTKDENIPSFTGRDGTCHLPWIFLGCNNCRHPDTSSVWRLERQTQSGQDIYSWKPQVTPKIDKHSRWGHAPKQKIARPNNCWT